MQQDIKRDMHAPATPPQPNSTVRSSASPTSSSLSTLFSASPSQASGFQESTRTGLSARAVAPSRGYRPATSPGGGSLSWHALGKGAGARREQSRFRALNHDELAATDPSELVRLLQEEWDTNDKAAARIAELETTRDALQDSSDRLKHLVARHVERESNAEAERSRLEDQLEGRNALVGRLRERVSALEREKRELDRCCSEQAKSFEAERQALYDNEQHLKSRLRTLAARPITRARSHFPGVNASGDASVSSLTLEPTPASQADEVTHLARRLTEKDAELKEMTTNLGTLERGYDTLQAAMDRSKEELADLKRVNAQLQGDIESYDLILTDRTSLSAMRSNSLLTLYYPRNKFAHADSLHSVDEEDEDSHLGNGTSRAGELGPNPVPCSQPSSAMREAFELETNGLDPAFIVRECEDEVSAAVRTVNIKGANWVLGKDGARRKAQAKGQFLGDYAVPCSGMDLAAELGRAEGDLRKLDKDDEGDAMRAEIKSLKEANKALALYTSKILNRILSVDGFENILNADAGNSLQGSMRRSSLAQRSSPSSRPSMQAFTFSPPGPVPAPLPAVDTTPKPAPPAVEEKNARRSSIDWRGGLASLFGSSPASPIVASPPPSAAQPPSKLRPLSLSSSPLLTSSPSEGPQPRARTFARRILTTDEVEEEEDRLQKKRVELLKLQLQEEAVQPPASGINACDGHSAGTSSHRRRSSSSSGYSHRASPLSPAFGTPPVRPEPIDSLVNPSGAGERSSYLPNLNNPALGLRIAAEEITEDLVASRLKMLDEDEARKASEISAGRTGGYSELSRRASISSRRASVSNRRTSKDNSEPGQRSPDERRWLEEDHRNAGNGTFFHYKDD